MEFVTYLINCLLVRDDGRRGRAILENWTIEGFQFYMLCLSCSVAFVMTVVKNAFCRIHVSDADLGVRKKNVLKCEGGNVCNSYVASQPEFHDTVSSPPKIPTMRNSAGQLAFDLKGNTPSVRKKRASLKRNVLHKSISESKISTENGGNCRNVEYTFQEGIIDTQPTVDRYLDSRNNLTHWKSKRRKKWRINYGFTKSQCSYSYTYSRSSSNPLTSPTTFFLNNSTENTLTSPSLEVGPRKSLNSSPTSTLMIGNPRIDAYVTGNYLRQFTESTQSDLLNREHGSGGPKLSKMCDNGRKTEDGMGLKRFCRSHKHLQPNIMSSQINQEGFKDKDSYLNPYTRRLLAARSRQQNRETAIKRGAQNLSSSETNGSSLSDELCRNHKSRRQNTISSQYNQEAFKVVDSYLKPYTHKTYTAMSAQTSRETAFKSTDESCSSFQTRGTSVSESITNTTRDILDLTSFTGDGDDGRSVEMATLVHDNQHFVSKPDILFRTYYLQHDTDSIKTSQRYIRGISPTEDQQSMHARNFAVVLNSSGSPYVAEKKQSPSRICYC